MAEFDVKKITTNDWIIFGGCIAVFIGVFLKWIGVSTFFGDVSVNGFHYFFQGTIPWLIAIAVAALILIRKFVPNVNLPENLGGMAWPQVYLIASAVAAVLVLSRLAMGDSGADRKIGLFLSSLGVVAMVVGSYLKFQAKEDDAAGAGPGTTPPTPF